VAKRKEIEEEILEEIEETEEEIEEEPEEIEESEEPPSWAKKLLQQAQQNPLKQEVQKVPVPQLPEPEEEQEQEQETIIEKPKKKSLLGWLL